MPSLPPEGGTTNKTGKSMNELIRGEIERFFNAYERENGVEEIWRQPLVGFAAAGDPLFAVLKSAIGPTHAMPADLLAEAETVVAFFIPFTKQLAASNAGGETASREWALAYIRTNRLINDVGAHMKTFLEGLGYPTFAAPATHNFDRKKLVSDWSHRHAAFIAGLGRFGVNNMLITDRGCCGRVGSFVTAAPSAANPRNDGEACLFRRKGTCLKCVRQCVNQALRADGFDRFRCYEMCEKNGSRFADIGIADVCGKCVVGLPCSHLNPASLH